MTKIQNLFLLLNIEIWDFIRIWCLEFEILQYSIPPWIHKLPLGSLLLIILLGPWNCQELQ